MAGNPHRERQYGREISGFQGKQGRTPIHQLPDFLSFLPPARDGFTRFAKTDIPCPQFADRILPAFGADSRSNSSDDRMNDTKVIGCLFSLEETTCVGYY